jgi:hypothetical protein
MLRSSLFSTFVFLLFASRAFSQSTPIPDFNFLNPPNANLAPFAVIPSTSAGIGSWQVPPPTPGFLFYEETAGSQTAAQATANWYNQAGVFYNNPSNQFITNLSSSQGGYIFDTPGLSLTQTLSSTFQVGKPYQLTVALGGGGEFGAMPLGDPIQLGLYYMSGGSQTFVGTTTVMNDGSNWNGSYVDHLTDYSLFIPAVLPGDPWANQNIGVALIEPDSAYGSASFYDIANVRLNAVPEPGSVALLLAAGLSIFGMCRRWSVNKQTL